MFLRNFAAYAATSVFAFGAIDARAALPEPCWQTGELPAVRLHDFKTMLLVGALKCRDRAPGSLEGYNQFVSQKRELIISSNHVVKARFIRDGGMTAGADGFTDYETSLANRYSAMAHDDVFCGQVGTYARLAASASDEDIGVLANTVVRAPSNSPCGAGGRASRQRHCRCGDPAGRHDGAAADRIRVRRRPRLRLRGLRLYCRGCADRRRRVRCCRCPSRGASRCGCQMSRRASMTATTPPAPSAAHALAEAAKALAVAAAALDAQNAAPAATSKPN